MNEHFTKKEFFPGVSGILRVMNEEDFVGRCIDSCIDALDELICVYNDSTDRTPDILREYQQRYPDKIKVYEYPHHIYSSSLTIDEYNMAIKLPLDSPHLLHNYYNFALSKVTREYAMKIDADQFYYTERLKYWTSICRGEQLKFTFKRFIGSLFATYFRYSKAFFHLTNKLLPIKPLSLFKKALPYYHDYLAYVISNKRGSLSMSGINVFKSDEQWILPVNKWEDTTYIWAYNGTGDHLIFPTRLADGYELFRKYEPLTSGATIPKIIERFVFRGKYYQIGPFWFHYHWMHSNLIPQQEEQRKLHPPCIEIKQFLNEEYDAKMKKLFRFAQKKKHPLPFFIQFNHTLYREEILKYFRQLIEE